MLVQQLKIVKKDLVVKNVIYLRLVIKSCGIMALTKKEEGLKEKFNSIQQKLDNLEKLNNLENIQVFHAGTKEINGKVFSNGGRVLNICARSESLSKSRKLVYENIKKIDWENGFYRKDIGKIT